MQRAHHRVRHAHVAEAPGLAARGPVEAVDRQGGGVDGHRARQDRLSRQAERRRAEVEPAALRADREIEHLVRRHRGQGGDRRGHGGGDEN